MAVKSDCFKYIRGCALELAAKEFAIAFEGLRIANLFTRIVAPLMRWSSAGGTQTLWGCVTRGKWEAACINARHLQHSTAVNRLEFTYRFGTARYFIVDSYYAGIISSTPKFYAHSFKKWLHIADEYVAWWPSELLECTAVASTVPHS